MTARPRILIVDDSDAVRNTVMDVLKDLPTDLPVEFIEATTGLEALELIKKEPLDVIILDLGLPDLSGMEVLEKGAGAKLELAPVIILTGYASIDTALQAGKLNAFNFISKAELSANELRVAVLDAISQSSASAPKTLLAAVQKFFRRAGFNVKAMPGGLAISKSSPEWSAFNQLSVSWFDRDKLTKEDVEAVERSTLALSPAGGIGFVVCSQGMQSGAPERIWQAREKGVFIVPLYYPKMRQVMEADDPDDCYRHLVDLKRSWCIMTDPYESLDATSDPQWFVGKHDLIEQILNHITSGDKQVIVYGMRKTGKTALLNQVELGCRAMRFPTARWIAMKGVGFETILHNFTVDLTTSAGRIYEGAVLSSVGTLQQYIENPTAQFKGDIRRLWSELSKHSGEKVKLVLLIDEMDINNFFPWTGDEEEHYQRYCDLFQTLKELTETIGEKSLRMIVAGEHYWIDEVQRFPYNERFQNPMFGRFLRLPLTFLTRRENAELVRLLGELAGLEYTSRSLHSIFEETWGHPQITRWLCSCIWLMRKRQKFDGKVTEATVARAVNYFLSEKEGSGYRNYFEQVFWCDPLSPDIDSDQQVLAEIAMREVCSTDELLTRLSDSANEFEQLLEMEDALASIRRLTELGIIEEIPTRVAHRITVPLYRKWIRIEKLGLV
jgi:two-component system, chemotaxis family, chemotaxis protein CheY